MVTDSTINNFDVFIIGGGVNGAGIARDAAGRGLNVGLADMGDLGNATSSCLLYTSPSPRDGLLSRMPSSA